MFVDHTIMCELKNKNLDLLVNNNVSLGFYRFLVSSLGSDLVDYIYLFLVDNGSISRYIDILHNQMYPLSHYPNFVLDPKYIFSVDWIDSLYRDHIDSVLDNRNAMLDELEEIVPFFNFNYNSMLTTLENKFDKRFKPRDVFYELQSSLKKFIPNDLFKFILSQHNISEDIIGTIENVFILAYSLYKAQSKTIALLSIISFLKLQLKKPCLILELQDIISNLLDDVDFRLTYETQSLSFEDFLNTSRTAVNNADSFIHSEFFKKFKGIIIFVLSQGLLGSFGVTLSTFGYNKLQEEILKKKFWSKNNMCLVLIESSLFILEKGYIVYKTGSIDMLYYNIDKYYDFFETRTKLKKWSKCIGHTDLMKIEGITESLYLKTLEEALEKGGNISQYLKTTGSSVDKKFFSDVLVELYTLKNDYLTVKFALQMRDAPFSILIYGDSGIAKSTILKILHDYFGKLCNLPLGDETMYTKNPVAKHWDNYNTSQWCIVQDDIAFLHPNVASAGDPTCMETIQINNNVPVVPHQAAIEKKGKMPLRAKLVIGTTNTKDMNAYYYYSCPSAFQRRFPFVVTVKIKDEYASDNGMIDSSKVPLNVGDSYPDYWKFHVESVNPQSAGSRSKATYSSILSTDSIYDFIAWYKQAIENHNSNQEKTKESMQNLREVSLCDNCKLPKVGCKCTLQGSLAIINKVEFFMYYYFLIMYYIKMFCFTYFRVSIDRVAAPLIFLFNFFLGYSPVSFQSRILSFYTYYTELQINFINKNDRLFSKYIHSFSLYKLSTPVGILKLIIALTLIKKFLNFFLGIKDYFSKDIYEVHSEGKSPVKDDKSKENIWYKGDYQLSQIDLSNKTLGWKELTVEQLVNKLAKNCYYFRMRNDTNYAEGRTTCLVGQWFVFNKHLIPNGDVLIIDLYKVDGSVGINENFSVKINRESFVQLPNTDMCMIQLHGMPPHASLLELIPNEQIKPQVNGFYVRRCRNGSIEVHNVKNINFIDMHYVDALDTDMSVWRGNVTTNTQSGDCGSILILQTHFGPVLGGIHFVGAASAHVVCSTVFVKSDIMKVISGLNLVESKGVSIDVPSVKVSLGDLHNKSEFKWISEGSAKVFGSLSLPRSGGKSMVEKSPMNEFLSQNGYVTKYTQPDLRSWKPWHLACNDMVNIKDNLDNSLLQKCVSAYVDDVKQLLPNGILEKFLHPYDYHTAVNGAAGVTFVDKINRNTSMGYPYNKSKRYYLKQITPLYDDQPDVVDFVDEIKDQVNSILIKYKSGELAHPIFKANLKDEPVTFEKRDLGKTRVFSGAPVAWSIVVRMYTLPFIRLVQSFQLEFEIACGISCQSIQWEMMYNHITQFGVDHMLGGDYSKFDKSMSAKIILAAVDIIIEFAKLSNNYDDEDLKSIKCIGYDMAFAYVNYNGSLVQFFGVNQSGHPLTVIINSLVNVLYMRMVYSLITNKDLSTFKKNVALMTYGDDNIMGVSKECSEFNHTNIQKCLAEFNIKYTMADKESDSVPYLNITECSFLKRSFRYDSYLEAIVAPLEHDSIEKMLMTWVKSKTISAEVQCCAVISSAMMEYFWYGRTIFEEKKILFQRLIDHLDLGVFVTKDTLPKYETLVERFKNSSAALLQP
jgi:hypothetical protein